jgi:hypothetical protein
MPQTLFLRPLLINTTCARSLVHRAGGSFTIWGSQREATNKDQLEYWFADTELRRRRRILARERVFHRQWGRADCLVCVARNLLPPLAYISMFVFNLEILMGPAGGQIYYTPRTICRRATWSFCKRIRWSAQLYSVLGADSEFIHVIIPPLLRGLSPSSSTVVPAPHVT